MRGNVRETKQNSLIPLEDVGVQESACVSAACEHYKRRVCSQHTHAFFDLKMRQIALVCLGPHSIPAANLVETRFSTSRPSLRAGLQHVFDQLSIFFVENLVANLLQQSRRVEHVSTCRTYQVRWFVRVLDKWNVGKKPVSSQPTNPFKLDLRYHFYY